MKKVDKILNRIIAFIIFIAIIFLFITIVLAILKFCLWIWGYYLKGVILALC